MRRRSPLWIAGPIIVLVLGLIVAVRADQGMWLFTSPPAKVLKDRYGFDADAKWLEHLQKSCVRFPGGSGSFVSPDGLVMTNHHVGRGAMAQVSTKDRNIPRDGFYAKSRDEEIKCPDLELHNLVSIEDVTDKVNAAVKPDMSAADAEKARRAVMTAIEKESLDKTGLRSDVVTLYQGGQYHLYRYKRYTDVRLVFSPDGDIAHFGGDADNFEFPRFCLDMCFFRVYEDGKPAKVEHYLKWSEAGAKENELVFVSGHPGRTSRLNTLAHLEFFRDKAYPMTLAIMRRREVMMKTWGDRAAENARRASAEYMGVQNSRKLLLGMLDGLQNPAIMERKRAEEMTLRVNVADGGEWQKAYSNAWGDVAESVKAMDQLYVPFTLLEGRGRGLSTGQAFNSHLFGFARTLVRWADEKDKPPAEQLREFRESALPTLKTALFSTSPIYADFETQKLADSLSMLVEYRGAKDKLVKEILAGKSPTARAAELVQGTKLGDATYRKTLFDGGRAAIEASDDPMINLAKLVDPAARDLRKQYEEKVEEPQAQAYAKISKAIFAVKGKNQYPDATFTLRLAFGPVKGYTENGTKVSPFTTFGGAYQRAKDHDYKEPFNLPKRWLDHKDKVDMATPFDFVCTADIIGGNSGSPVVNKKGEVVGLIFDGNIQSLVADFAYTEEQARAVAVDSRGIIEALRKVYDAGALADEMTGKK
jgi:hypothetical protein